MGNQQVVLVAVVLCALGGCADAPAKETETWPTGLAPGDWWRYEGTLTTPAGEAATTRDIHVVGAVNILWKGLTMAAIERTETRIATWPDGTVRTDVRTSWSPRSGEGAIVLSDRTLLQVVGEPPSMEEYWYEYDAPCPDYPMALWAAGRGVLSCSWHRTGTNTAGYGVDVKESNNVTLALGASAPLATPAGTFSATHIHAAQTTRSWDVWYSHEACAPLRIFTSDSNLVLTAYSCANDETNGRPSNA